MSRHVIEVESHVAQKMKSEGEISLRAARLLQSNLTVHEMSNSSLLARYFLVAIGIATPSVAIAADWVISRAKMSGACHVQLETSRPYLGELLPGKYPTRKASCEKAKTLKTNDATETSRCFEYTTGTADGCKADGVILP